MSFLHPRKQRAAGEAQRLDPLGRASASLPQDGIGGFVFGDAPQGFGSGESIGREAVASGSSHGGKQAAGTRVLAMLARCGISAKGCGGAVEMEREAPRRIRRLLKRFYPAKTAENLAVILRISVRQAYDLLSGKARWTWRHVLRLLDHFRDDFVRLVILPLIGRDDGRPRLQFRRRREVA